MKRKNTQFAVFCVIASWFFLSVPLVAEESYARFTVRTWTYRDGTQAAGKMISVSGSTASLMLEGKGNVRVPLEKLSVKDLNWIYEFHKRNKKLNFLSPKYRKPQLDLSETKPESTASKSEKNQPEKKMTAGELKQEESYKPFTVREWTLKDGSKYPAKFLHIAQKKAVLIKGPSQTVRFPLDQLSEKDLNWLVEYHRRSKLLSLLPEEYRDHVAKSQPAVKKMNSNLPQGNTETLAEQKGNVDTEIDAGLVAALQDYRVWTDKNGYKVEARFTGIDGQDVLFAIRPEGFARVGIDTLIEEDLQLLREALKMHGRFDEIPLVYREPLDPNLTSFARQGLIRVNNHREWTDRAGNSVRASYVKMEDGKVVLLITKTAEIQEFPYSKFIADDQAYVQQRLLKEIPGNFFPPDVKNVIITPKEKENGFRVWTDRSNRKIKGKFIRLAYGDSVAVINTGEKEELFIIEYFSDPDLSLLKPEKQKQTNELVMSKNYLNVGGFNRGQGKNSFSNGSVPGMTDGSGNKNQELECPLCKKKHTADSATFELCPHCGLKGTDSIFVCEQCSRSYKSDFPGVKSPCPHCEKKQQKEQVASNRNFSDSGSSSGSGSFGSGSWKDIGQISGLIFFILGIFILVRKLRD